MWHDRFHKYLHRVIGVTVALVGLLQQLQAIDLSKLIGEQHAGEAVAIIGLVIVLLEFLPILGKLLDDHKDGQKC